MVHLTSELFVQCLYSPDLSYEALHKREEELTTLLEDLFDQHGARAITFTPSGDALHAQCELPAHNEDTGHSFCAALAIHLQEGLEGRLLFVRKNLELVSLYTIAGGTWKECDLTPPPAGDIGEAMRRADYGMEEG